MNETNKSLTENCLFDLYFCKFSRQVNGVGWHDDSAAPFLECLFER